ncbi:DUF1479-domain-containing protein [Aspergillus heteromorphus CBS 117.55]|uniref:DUF1479-domain-containing protein n=1 Tax=Aspergillus heteromorphus CBS 117.55 TaxID=1448321 RepID=A0A317WSV1_9EURO|nr:DUF1479-domain-containing protein [Aspergillus heteromorphus CBS 117.55]PWY88267.1 DUF1479-domain-containing protein [Aspergillus heteromorphus CBS 117.55]
MTVAVGKTGSPDAEQTPVPAKSADQIKRLIARRQEQVKRSWARLLKSDVIPSIDFKDIQAAPRSFQNELRKRGVAVIRGVVPEEEARAYKKEIEAYFPANPIFELYWSKPQMRAHLHPNMAETQRFLMSFWQSHAADAKVSPIHPLTYADRVRIRQPGDAGFALGAHVDGGSGERWEDNGYGLGDVDQRIWEGRWEEYDPWEASCCVPAVADRYNGAGACSMFRMFQGWLGISHVGPKEGTLLVNPILSMATAYYLLRPFFEPISKPPSGGSRLSRDTPSSKLEGATPGFSQELNDILHPHMELEKTMVHVPQIVPGDYVAWHCDTIHSVDEVHQEKGDSSVLCIPACPVTEANMDYVPRQKQDFLAGVPPPNFPGGKGESEHVGRTTEEDLRNFTNEEGLKSFGFAKWDAQENNLNQGQRWVLEESNRILGL